MSFLWCLEVYAAAWFGYQFATSLTYKYLGFWCRFALGIPIGICSLTWLIFILSYFWPMNKIYAYIMIPLFAVPAFFMKLLNDKRKLKMRYSYDYIHQWTIIFCVFFYGIIMYASMLSSGTSTKGAAYSDLPFHLNIISSLAYGINYKRKGFFSMDSTFYHGENLAYPIIPDFLSAALITTGDASLQQSLFIPSTMMIFSVMMSVWAIAKYYTNNSTIGCICILLFSCLGGLAFIMLFDPSTKFNEDDDFFDFIHHWPMNIDEYWFQTVMHMLVPQRSSLFGIPLCFWSILLLIIGQKKNDPKLFFVAAILTGFTPQVQAHAYMSMAQWAVAFCLITFPYKGKWTSAIKNWCIYGILANVMAFPQLPPFFKRMKDAPSEFIEWSPVWRERGVGFTVPLVMWWRGLGVFGFCALIGGWATASKEQILLYIPSLVVFVISNVIKYQNWEYDNIKVFVDGWIPIALPFAAQFMFWFYDRAQKRIHKAFSSIVFILLIVGSIASGCLSILLYLGSPTDIYTHEQVDFGNWVAENTPISAVFIGDKSTEQPVASIGGRPVMSGFPGWIVSHGLDQYTREHVVDTLMSNPDNTTLFDEYGVRYVYLSGMSDVPFTPGEDSKVWQLLYDEPNITLWGRI